MQLKLKEDKDCFSQVCFCSPDKSLSRVVSPVINFALPGREEIRDTSTKGNF